MKYLNQRYVIFGAAIVIAVGVGFIAGFDQSVETPMIGPTPVEIIVTQPDAEIPAIVREGSPDVAPTEEMMAGTSRPRFRGGQKPDNFLGGQKPDNGLQKIDKPKFVFGLGASLILFLIGAAIKLAVILAIAVVVIVYLRNRAGRNGSGVRKDPVDSLIASFDHIVDKIEVERDKHAANAERLSKSLGRLRDGIADRISGKKKS
jgi:hypothetical protein